MEKSIRILIVDDHPLLREGLQTLLSRAGMEVVGEAANGQQAVDKARQLAPDIILMDLVMPEMDGLQASRAILQENPAARILILSSFGDDEKALPAIRSGVAGYILKDTLPQELLEAIHNVVQGLPALHPAIASKLMRELQRQKTPLDTSDELTSREMDVLKLVAKGYSNQEIADQLVISERTARTHVGNILRKLHLANRTQATIYALQEGLVTPEGQY